MQSKIKCVQTENKFWSVVLNIQNGEENNIELNFGFTEKESALKNALVIMGMLHDCRINDAGRHGWKDYKGHAIIDVVRNMNDFYMVKLVFLDDFGNTIKLRTILMNAGDKESAMKLATEYKESFETISVNMGE